MKLLFFITKQYSLSIIDPIREFCNHNSIEFAWFKAGDAKKIVVTGPCLKSNTEVFDFNPDAIIVPGNVVPNFWPGIKVQIFHGLCEEKRGHYDITGFFDLYCTPGPVMTENFLSLQEKYGTFLVKETGWSKLDTMFNQKPIEEYKTDMGLDPSKPTILYAPTFSKRYTSSSDLFHEIKVLQNQDWQWIAKFHDLEEKDVIKQYELFASDHFRIIKDEGILPWIFAADILITDTSSVAYEFLPLNRPIVTYRATTRLDKGIDIMNPQELHGALIRSLEDPLEFNESRKNYLNDLHPYRDGKSSERIVKAISESLKSEELNNLKSKPLNWFRKRQIRKIVTE